MKMVKKINEKLLSTKPNAVSVAKKLQCSVYAIWQHFIKKTDEQCIYERRQQKNIHKLQNGCNIICVVTRLSVLM